MRIAFDYTSKFYWKAAGLGPIHFWYWDLVKNKRFLHIRLLGFDFSINW